ncbi:MAG: hypothetical protein Fur0037_03910 [Planctomycetota bacterium]
MISGPILPTTAEGVRQILEAHPERIERGLSLEVTDLDFTHGALGPIDVLCRDAAGRPVALFAAHGEDLSLAPRIAATAAFVRRNASALPLALPQVRANLAGPWRFLVAASSLSEAVLEDLRGLGIETLEVLVVEPFFVGGQERLVIRDALRRTPVEPPCAPEPAAWDRLLALVARIDPAIRIGGDRYFRRILCRGEELGEFWIDGDRVRASVPGAAPSEIATEEDALRFADLVLRAVLARADGAPVPAGRESSADAARAGESRGIQKGMTLGALRKSLSASRLTREEYSALGDLTGGGESQETG